MILPEVSDVSFSGFWMNENKEGLRQKIGLDLSPVLWSNFSEKKNVFFKFISLNMYCIKRNNFLFHQLFMIFSDDQLQFFY